MLQCLKCKLMLMLLDIYGICCTIERLNSYNLLTKKVAGKVIWTIYRPGKNTKNVLKNWKWTFYKWQYLKPSHTYWPTHIAAKKKQTVERFFLCMSVLNTFQCKQFLCILTLPKCDEYLIDQIAIIYKLKETKLKDE